MHSFNSEYREHKPRQNQRQNVYNNATNVY